MITGAQLASITDEMARFRLRAAGTAPTYGLGQTADTDRCRAALNNLNTAILAVADIDFISAVSPGLSSAELLAAADAVTLSTFSEFFRRLNLVINSYQVPNALTFHDFVRYLNVSQVTKWQCLLHPEWATMLALFVQNSTFSTSLFYQTATLATRTAGVYADGAEVDPAVYAGGFCVMDVSGFGGAQSISINGDGFDPADETVKNVNWTGNITGNVTGQALTPDVANALIVDCFAMTGANSGETVTIRAAAPTGRPTLP